MIYHLFHLPIHSIFIQEWKEVAITLDEYLGFQEWKRSDEDPFYDWMLIRKVCQPHLSQTLLELKIYLGQAIFKNPPRQKRRTGMLRSSGDVHSFKFCCCGIFEVRRIHVVSGVLQFNLLPLKSGCTAK